MTVELDLPMDLHHIHPIFHFSFLKKCPLPDAWHPAPAAPPPLIMNGELHQEVEEILDSKLSRNCLYYLIHWKHFGSREDEWVCTEHVNAPHLVKEFHKQHPLRPGGQILRGVGCMM